MSAWKYAIAAATAPDGSIFVIGGAGTNGVTTTVEVLSPHGNKWSVGPSLPSPRYRLAAATGGDGRVYAIGGSDAGYLGIFASVFALTPGASQWVEVAPMPTPRQLPAATTGIDGLIYVAGGSNVLNSTVNILNALEIYNPATGRWTTGAPMPTPRYDPAMATAPDGRIYVIGGFGDAIYNISNVVEVYSPVTRAWTTAAPIPEPRRGLADAVTGSDGLIYLIGGCEVVIKPSGWDCANTRRVDVYSPDTNTWQSVEPTLEDHREGAAVISGKRIYAIGGHTTAVESAK